MTASNADDPVQIRRAQPGDLPGILDLEEASFSRPQERFSLRRVRHLLRSPRAIILIAQAGEQRLGWAVALVQHRSGRTLGRIYALAVHPLAQGKHIGRLLAEHIIAALGEHRVHRMLLEVRADNAPALALYRKLGFSELKRLPHLYGEGCDGVRMARAGSSG
jgi:ribosomal-protein-alanine N-acetyltransferase